MGKLIDVDALMKFPIRKDHCDKKNANEHFIMGIESVLEYAECLPTVDAVEVVRCKDCRKCDHSFPMKPIGEEAVEAWYCNTFRQWRNPDDFCSYGERRVGNDS